MIQFSEKHFQGQFSVLFRFLLTMGIWLKAGISFTVTGIGKLKKPMIDIAFAAVSFGGAALFWEFWNDKVFGQVFWQAVLPFYVIIAVLGLAITGNYSTRRPARIRAIFSGLGIAFLVIIVVSFFVKQIAFSRAVLLLGFTGAFFGIGIKRFVSRIKKQAPRRCVLVGTYKEAVRLQSMLAASQNTELILVGYVSITNENITPAVKSLAHLGSVRQLRDIVRLNHLTDVIFAAAGVSHHIMFTQMQLLHDLPIQFRIFTEHYDTLIGKATIDDLTAPTLQATDPPAGFNRSATQKRLFEVIFATAGLSFIPVLWILKSFAPKVSLLKETYQRFRQFGQVLSGKKALIGYDTAFSPDKLQAYDLKEAVFALTDFLPAGRHSETERNRAYQWYVQKQSLSLDLEIIWRILSQPIKSI